MNSLNTTFLDQAFVSNKLLIILMKLSEYKGKHELYVKQTPQILEILKGAARIESVEASNRIEGVIAAPKRLQEIVRKGSTPTNRSEREIAGYRDVLETIHLSYDSIPVTPNYILQLHRDLYSFSPEGIGGEWKRTDNEIAETLSDGTRHIRFRPTPAWQTPNAMRELCDRYRHLTESGEVDPLILIPAFVLDFLCIHPFSDGNGRMSRLLTLLLLYQSGHMVGRYISLERIIEKQKEGYYETLGIASQGWHEGIHSIVRWREYFLGVVLLSAYKEFEERVGTVNTGTRGAKAGQVQNAIKRLPHRFRFEDVQRAAPGVSDALLRKIMGDLKKEGQLLSGRGPSAYWEKTGAFDAGAT